VEGLLGVVLVDAASVGTRAASCCVLAGEAEPCGAGAAVERVGGGVWVAVLLSPMLLLPVSLRSEVPAVRAVRGCASGGARRGTCISNLSFSISFFRSQTEKSRKWHFLGATKSTVEPLGRF
jgi:hypothetical protein